MFSSLSYSLVIRECSWKKTQIEKNLIRLILEAKFGDVTLLILKFSTIRFRI